MLAATRLELAQQNLEIVRQATGLDIDILRRLVRAGVIDGLVPNWTDPGMADIEQAHDVARTLDMARLGVEGNPIGAYEAAEKYNFSNQSVYRWYQLGWVRLIEQRGRKKLFNEGDIAFARALADMCGLSGSQPVFPAQPKPGRPRNK